MYLTRVCFVSEKATSTILVRDVNLRGSAGSSSIWIENSDAEKHNIVWLERLSVRGGESLPSEDEDDGDEEDDGLTGFPAVTLLMKSAYVLVRNVEFSSNAGRAVYVIFASETREKESEVTITQNTIYGSRGAVFVANGGVRDANVWITRNDIRYSQAPSHESCIHIVNATLEMEGNIIYNNEARFILELVDREDRALPKKVVGNLFWLNIGLEQSSMFTVAVAARDLVFTGNALQNPVNSFEFTPVVM